MRVKQIETATAKKKIFFFLTKDKNIRIYSSIYLVFIFLVYFSNVLFIYLYSFVCMFRFSIQSRQILKKRRSEEEEEKKNTTAKKRLLSFDYYIYSLIFCFHFRPPKTSEQLYSLICKCIFSIENNRKKETSVCAFFCLDVNTHTHTNKTHTLDKYILYINIFFVYSY